MLVNKSSTKLHEYIKINSTNSTIKGENVMKKETIFISAFNAEKLMKIR
jgi:hypothetical protein